MKKILLASTILVGSAGVAAADVSFSGSAFMGIDSNDGGATWNPKVTASLDVAMSGETDGGLMFGADFSINPMGFASGASSPYLTFTGSDAIVSGASVWISGDFGKVTLATETVFLGIFVNEVTLSYEHSIGDFGVEVNYEWFSAAWDFELSYDFGDYDVYLNHNSAGVTGLGGNAAFGDFTVGLDIGDISAISTTWEITAGYSMDAISVDVTIGAGSAWELAGAYDLGGGAAVEASFDDGGNYSLGVSMTF